MASARPQNMTTTEGRTSGGGESTPAKGWSYRVKLSGKHRGIVHHTFMWPKVKSHHLVFATANEIGEDGNPWLGQARVSILNVAPGNGFIDFRFEVDWEYALPIMVDFLVIEEDWAATGSSGSKV